VRAGGTGVELDVGEGTGEGITVGDGVAVQEANNKIKRIKSPNRFIRPPFIQVAFGVL
jgi:hypothetical protein